MKNYLLGTVIVFALFVSDAMAQRIPDLSLSPAETSQQPNITNNNPATFQNDVSRRSMESNRSAAPPGLPNNRGMVPAKKFMDGYCDPSFVPMLANNRKYFGQEACLQQEREDSCARFANLPDEVKSVLDDAISCLFTNGNGYAADNATPTDNDYMACGASYGHRMELLKKYYQDAYASYALVYLPDNVLDASGQCINRR